MVVYALIGGEQQVGIGNYFLDSMGWYRAGQQLVGLVHKSLNSHFPLDSIRDAVLTVSPKRQ